MLTTTPTDLDALLDGTAEFLDIPKDLRLKAVEQYQWISRWLIATCRAPNTTTIYPQGSFRIGTVIRPICHEDHYDIDLVFLQDIRKENITQAQLKESVGNLLAAFVEAHRDEPDCPELVERGRCWTLLYETLGFHLDVLPAIPDEEANPTGILLTDRDLYHWQHSDPIAYSRWFTSRMAADFDRARAAVAKALGRSIEEVPDFLIRTPLQRTVQVLKRHRDLYFVDDLELRPPSILLTTLAGLAYEPTGSLIGALSRIVHRMPDFLGQRQGTWWLPNPVHPQENFADKWNTNPERREAFEAWRVDLGNELTGLPEIKGIDEIAKAMMPHFGERSVKEAVAALGERIGATAAAGGYAVTRGGALTVAAVASAPALKRHTFHGPCGG